MISILAGVADDVGKREPPIGNRRRKPEQLDCLGIAQPDDAVAAGRQDAMVNGSQRGLGGFPVELGAGVGQSFVSDSIEHRQ